MSDPDRKRGEPENADEVRDYFENLRHDGEETQDILDESKRRHGSGVVVILLVLLAFWAALQLYNWIM